MKTLHLLASVEDLFHNNSLASLFEYQANDPSK